MVETKFNIYFKNKRTSVKIDNDLLNIFCMIKYKDNFRGDKKYIKNITQYINETLKEDEKTIYEGAYTKTKFVENLLFRVISQYTFKNIKDEQ